ncbi:MAG: hypothetical protein ABEJ04_05395 [Halobacteriaceae archaeon]
MRRRALLAAAAATAAGSAGCLGFLSEKPMLLRARRADGDETDVRCVLSDDVVDAHPALDDVLRMADAQRSDGWVTRDVTRDRAEKVVAALERTCEETGGLYRYGGNWYFVSVQYKDATEHGDGPEHSH